MILFIGLLTLGGILMTCVILWWVVVLVGGTLFTAGHALWQASARRIQNRKAR